MPTPETPDRQLTRIINTFLLYAIRDKATEIHIKHLSKDGLRCVVTVLHTNGEVANTLPLADSWFQPLRERLEEIAGDEAVIDAKIEGEIYPFAICYQREMDVCLAAEVETVILKLQEKSSSHS